MTNEELKNIGKSVRRAIIEMGYRSKGGHIGCSLSCADIIIALYFSAMRIDPKNPLADDRDRFILSKGHSAAALYAVLAERGFFPKEELQSYFSDGSRLAGHVVLGCVPGTEASTGSEGHGLSLGEGMAFAAIQKKNNARVFVIVGDGEMEEGSTWEAVMSAGHHKVGNLTMIVDYNRLQIMGNPEDILGIDPLDEKLKNFKWDVDVINGHDFDELIQALNKKTDRPHAIIAHTIKGKDVSFMENKVEWHGKSLDENLYQTAIKELS